MLGLVTSNGMKYTDTIKMATGGLSTHKTRSLLTILGIVIGISSIILVMSLGNSAQGLIVGQVEGLGPNLVYIIPGRQPEGFQQGAGTLLEDSLKEKDFQDLRKKSNIPGALSVHGMVFTPVAASYGPDYYNSMILGVTSGISDLFKLEMQSGNFISDEDILAKNDVVVIGQKVVEKLFGLNNPIGEKIKIKDKNYRVIGVLAPKGQSPFVNFDESIIAPVSTVQQYIMGIKYYQRVVLEAVSSDEISNVSEDIKALLRSNHNITDPAKDDFFIQTQADLVKTIGTVTTALTVLLGSIAGISLLVGGVGIMNIMFVSVTERTKEIGLRKALGATNKDILTQFLTEAVILTVIGGIVGILLGTTTGYLATVVVNKIYALGFPFTFSYTGAILGVLVSSLIGFTFGIFPARIASKKSPIEALRYE